MEKLILNYQLAELPSAQHRAGLAGLILAINELKLQDWFLEDKDKPVIKGKTEEYSAEIELNLEGLKALFDLVYDSFLEERSTTNKIKNSKEIKEEEVADPKTGKTKKVKRYYYDVVTPTGAFLAPWDKSSEKQNEGIWIKLWRSMMWSILRGIPTTRNPYNNRVGDKKYSQDAEDIWQELNNSDKTNDQKSQFYLGALATNSEYVPVKDRAKYQFLLHFTPLVMQVYCPASLKLDGDRELNGYALAIPDVANLKKFCSSFRKVIESRTRSSDKFKYLPRDAVIDLVEESALDFMLLENAIARETGSQRIARTILGVEVIHAEKIGNSIKIRSINYVEPIRETLNRYEQIRKEYWCPWFRKQRLLNLVRQKPAWYEFDDLLSRAPRQWLNKEKLTKTGIDKSNLYFSHDAQAFFRVEVFEKFNGDKVKAMTQKVRDTEVIVYSVCQSYVLGKLKNKYDLEWKKGTDKQNGYPTNSKTKAKVPQSDYDDKKHKIANEAFLAVRSRTEKQVFVDYFVSSLYPFIKEKEFAQFAQVLFDDKEWKKIRALTLLALASQFPSGKSSETEESSNNAA